MMNGVRRRRGPYTNWEARHTHWNEVFQSIDRSGILQTHLDTDIPLTTLRRRYNLHLANDQRATKPAYHLRGRHFTDEHEQQILESVEDDRRMYNSKDIRPTALSFDHSIHQADAPADSTRSHRQSRPFKATSNFASGFRRRHHM
jgi:hypothetical protein